MGMPRVLKNFNVFYNGVTHIGQCQELELPKLSRKMEDFRAGGMTGEVSIDLGQEKLELVQTYGGLMYDILQQYAIGKADGVMLRFAGAYQRDDSGEVDAIEVVCRGRHKEIDFGKQAAGDKTEFKVTSALTYYKLSVNGLPYVELDLVNFVETIFGEDRLATQRLAIGA